jgi:hypothetical protein
MTTVEDILAAIDKLSLSERAELERRLHGWTDDAWDEQIKSDYDAGRLDKIINEVRDDIRAGRLEDGP